MHFGASLLVTTWCVWVMVLVPITALIRTIFTPSLMKRRVVPTYGTSNKFEPDAPFQGFNPFEQRSSFGGSSVSGKYSLRQVTLKQIMSELISACNSEKEMRDILNRNEKFLMEQFDELDSFLEADSIFTSTMDRYQRFDQYKVVMGERIANAKSESVKKTLLCMTKFVLEHDERLGASASQAVET